MLDEEKLVELLVRRDDLLEQGRDATPEEVCAECPELIEEYKARLESLKRTEFLFETDDGEADESFTSPGSATVAINGPDLPSSSLTIEQFLRAITNSGLMTEKEVESFQQSVSADTSSDTPSLARELVQRQKLTLYQASVLLTERSDPLLLDRYIILDTIDSGGMGLVFKALHRSLDRVVALKTLPPSALDSEEKVKRFQREAKTAALLSHPNIVTTHDAHESNGVHFLVMEYVKGKDLRKVVKTLGPLPVATAVDYVLQAARGLEHAHAQGIIHRDIKPGNLLLDADGTVKVLDLGLARLETLNGATETEEDLTAVGGVMGTAAYMSPEQAADTHDAGARSDIYSLGCTLYFLLTGKPPYKESTLVNTVVAHREKPIPPLSKGRDDVPEDVIGVYRRMMAKKPEDRYQSMTEVIEALSGCEVVSKSPSDSIPAVAKRGVPDIETTMEYKPQSSKKRQRWRIAGAVGMLLLLVPVLGGIILKIKKPVGTLVVEVNEPGAVVQVFNEKGRIEIEREGGKGKLAISVDPGSYRLKVKKEGFSLFTTNFEIESGGKKSIPVRLEPLVVKEEVLRAAVVPPSTNYALEFDGEDDYVEISNLKCTGVHPVTLEAFFNFATIREQKLIEMPWLRLKTSSAGINFEMQVSTNDRLYYRQGSHKWNTNTLVHVAGVFDQRTIDTYLNGMRTSKPVTVIESEDKTFRPLGQDETISGTFDDRIGTTIAASSGSKRLFFHGIIDEVRISNIARYTENFMPQRHVEPDEHTMALFHFDEGSGDVLHDSSGNGHHGKIVGAKWVRVDDLLRPVPDTVDDSTTVPPLATGLSTPEEQPRTQ